MPTTQKKTIKTIHLDSHAIIEVGRKLESMQRPVSAERRRSPRLKTQMKACILHVPRQDVSEVPAYLVSTRDISNFGITFLHGAFIYPGSRCILQLVSNHDIWKNVVVQIVHSTYVSNGIHNTGARFQAPIEARDFSAHGSTTRILIVEDNPLIAAMTEQHLAAMDAEIEIEVAKTGEKAVAAARKSVFDCVLMDMQLPGIDGFATTRQLRDQGFVGMIVAATGMTSAGIKQQCIAAGCNSYLPKPVGREQLAALIASLRTAPLISSQRGDPLMRPLIDEFISDLPVRVREIETAYAGNDLVTLQTLCRGLKGEAGAFGFDQITEAAGAVEKGVIDGLDQPGLKESFERVVRLCCQVRTFSDG